jgi:magnesium transporter
MSTMNEIKDNINEIESFLNEDIDYDMSAAEIAKCLQPIKKEDEPLYLELLEKLPNDILGDVVLELPEYHLKSIVENISSAKLSEVIEELESDDAAELMQDIEDVNEDKAEEIFAGLDKEDQEDIKRLSMYEDDEAGSYMQTEVFTASYDEKIQDAIDRLRQLKLEGELENIHQVSVVGKLNRLLYTVFLEDLITFDFSKSFREALEDKEEEFKPRYVTDDEDISEVIELFEDYDLSALPVVNEHGCLLGRITADDIHDVIQERATEQIYNLAGVDDEAEHEEGLYEAGKSRMSWLFLNLITAIVASLVIGLFDQVLQAYVALAVLMPIVASMGGNAGTQTLTIMVRQLALGEVDFENSKDAIQKEIILSGINGLVFALLIGVISFLWFQEAKIGLVIAAAMIINLLCAGFFGAIIPLSLKKLGIDPAIGSTVFLTTITDVVGFLSFLGLASLVLM